MHAGHETRAENGRVIDNLERPTMGMSYENDVVAWAREQATLLRERKFSAIDVEYIAEEIEAVGRAEQRELVSRMSVFLTGLLLWKHLPCRRTSSWKRTIKVQRLDVAYLLDEAPSLRLRLIDAKWMNYVWARVLAQAVSDTGFNVFPETCPWSVEQVLDEKFLPD